MRIAIIGGGYAGASMAFHLVERFGNELRSGGLQVSMFERTRDAGLGLAWSGAIASDCQLCNLPVGALCLTDALRPTFQEWLVESHATQFAHDESLAAAFPPRRFFGEYVQAMIEQQLAGHPGVSIHTDAEALAVEPSQQRYRVSLQSPTVSTVEADAVVLCTGAPTDSGCTRFEHLSGCAGYIESPWPSSELTDALQGATRIAIIGTGLTAIDVVKHVARTVPGVPVLMTSRQGRFNVVFRNRGSSVHQCQVLTAARLASLPAPCPLDECVDLVKREIEGLDDDELTWAEVLSPTRDGVAEWRDHVATCRAGRPCRWQPALDAIDGVFPQLWRRLTDEDRERWLASGMRTIYQNYTNPLPVESAEEVLSLIDDGRVVVRSGLRAIEPRNEGGFRLSYEDDTVDVSHCVNCTGVGFDLTHDHSPLMQQLLRDGLLLPHRFGGAVVDPDSCRVMNNTGTTHGMYVVGHGTKGARYLTSGLGFLRSMIAGVLDDLSSAIR